MKSLDEVRKDIDAIDDEILQLLSKRAALSLEVKKTAGGTGALRRGREKVIIERMKDNNPGPFSDEAIEDIYEAIVYNGRGLQLELTIAYLGPQGTYSEDAAKEMFGAPIDLEPKRSLKEVVRSLESGDSHVAVLPIENSSEGAVVEAHKLVRETSLPIIAEHTLNIHHALLSKGEDLSAIKAVYAHPQALGQCREWLAANMPNAELVECSSNAKGIEFAKGQDAAAIASERNAVTYGMNVLAKTINDEPNNATRFIALGKDPVPATGKDKTSLVCTVHERAGALHDLLGVLNKHNISMTRLESQPDGEGGYAFFIDFLGHKDDKAVAEAIDELEKRAASLKVFGSYPRES